MISGPPLFAHGHGTKTVEEEEPFKKIELKKNTIFIVVMYGFFQCHS